jgi:O-antigen/teichoic acid export membrane protein
VKVVKNVSITVAASFVSAAAAAASAWVVASVLGSKGAGTFAEVRVIPAVIASLLGAGVTISNPYMVAAKRYPVQAITETTVALGLIIGGLGWFGWWLCGSLLHAHVYTELTVNAALLVGISIPLQMIRSYLNSIQQGMLTFRGANLVVCTEEVASLILVLPLLFGFHAGSTTIVLAAVGGTVLSCSLAVVLLWYRGVYCWPRLHWQIAVDSMVFGMKGHIGRMANLLNWRLDVMILSLMAPVSVVGYYSVASKVAEMFRPLSAGLNFVLRPLIATLSAEEAAERGARLYRWSFGINLIAVAILAVVARPLVLRFFGDEFAAAIPALYILLIGLAARGSEGVISGYNVGIGKPEYNTYTALIGLAITLVGDVTTIPTWSLIGAAWTSSVAYTAKAVAYTVIFLSTSGMTLSQLIGLEACYPNAPLRTAERQS